MTTGTKLWAIAKKLDTAQRHGQRSRPAAASEYHRVKSNATVSAGKWETQQKRTNF